MNEIVPGIHHGTAHHASMGARASSYYVAPAGVVVDPKQPEGGWEALPGKTALPESLEGPVGHEDFGQSL